MEDANQFSAMEVLRDLLTAHGLRCPLEQGWFIPNGELPAISAQWHPGEKAGRFDVQVLLDEDRVIEECFAGFGAGQTGFADAVNNFTSNSLHVLLSALWGITDDEQVVVQRWDIGGRPFTAHIGNYGRRTTRSTPVDIPKDLFATIQNQICRADLPGDLHWFRFFFCNMGAERSYEALRDNAPWEAGIAGLKTVEWPASDGFYTVRNFIILRAA